MPPSALPSTTQVNPLITCEGIRSVLGRGDAALSYPSKSSYSRAWPTRPRKRSLECLTCRSLRAAAKPIAYGGGVGHAPTDARRLAGVISLVAVIGGPHPHLRES